MEYSSLKTNVTLLEVERALKLSPLQIKNLCRGILAEPPVEKEETVSERTLFFLFLADMLNRIGGLSSDEQNLLLTEIATREPAAPLAPDALRQLVIADGAFATWTGNAGFLRLGTGDMIEATPVTPVETIGYNLDELWRRNMALIAAINKREAHNAENACAGSADQ